VTAIVFALLAIIPCDTQGWTRTDVALQSTLMVSLAADYIQTRTALNTVGVEQNPVMGPDGSRVSPEMYFALVGVVSLATADALPRPYRTVFQAAIIAVQIHTIEGNWRAGYAVSF
jgi:hypothetical protein